MTPLCLRGSSSGFLHALEVLDAFLLLRRRLVPDGRRRCCEDAFVQLGENGRAVSLLCEAKGARKRENWYLLCVNTRQRFELENGAW